MGKSTSFLLEVLGLSGMIGLIAYISWTKMALGAVLAILGAFFPSLKETRQSHVGESTFSWHTISIRFAGGIRLAVVTAGVILIVGAVLDGQRERDDSPRRHAEVAIAKYIETRERIRRILDADAKKRGVPMTYTEAEIDQMVLQEINKEAAQKPVTFPL